MNENTKVTIPTDPETIVRRAYHAAEGNVMDLAGIRQTVRPRWGDPRRP